MSDLINKRIYFPDDAQEITDQEIVKDVPVMSVHPTSKILAKVNVEQIAQEAGKHVGDTVKIDGLVLPTLGEGNKRATVRGGSTGKTFTYGSTTIEIGANMVADLFWDGTAGEWSKVGEVEMPKADNKIENWTAKAYTTGEQVIHNDTWWEAVVNTTSAQEPGVVGETIWKKVIKRILDLDSFVNGEIEMALPYEEGYLNNLGVFIPDAAYRTSPMIPVRVEGFPFLYRGSSGPSRRAMYAYDANGTLIAPVLENINTNGKYVSAIPPSGAAFIRGSATATTNLSILGGLSVKKNKVEGLVGFENKVNEMAIKLSQPYDFAIDELLIGYISTSGIFTESVNWRSTDFIETYPGTIVRYKGTSGTSNISVAGYNYSKEFIEDIIIGSRSVGDGYIDAVIPEGVSYIRFSSQNVAGISFIASTILPVEGGIDYKHLKKEVPHTWNAVGHSIWAVNVLQPLIREKIIFSGYNNYGYSGKCLTQVPAGASSSILSHKDSWVPAKIWSFDSITNDHKLNKPIGVEDDFLNNTGASTFYGALRVLHDTIKALQPDYTMICASPLQKVDGTYTSFSANTLGHTLQDYTDALLFVANRLSWRYVDQFKNSGFNMDNILLYTNDGLHPNAAGYGQYAGLWINEFYKL